MSAQRLDLGSVGIAEALPDGSLGDVATDVLLIVGFLLRSSDLPRQIEQPDLLLFRFFKFQQEMFACLFVLLIPFGQEFLITRPLIKQRFVEEFLHAVGGTDFQLGQIRAEKEGRTTHVEHRLHTPQNQTKYYEVMRMDILCLRTLLYTDEYL